MITLREKKGAVHICDIVEGKRKTIPVNWLVDYSTQDLNQTENLHALLKPHFDRAKDDLRVNQRALDVAVELLQHEKEPDQNSSADERKSFFHLKRLQRELLTSEMDLRGTKQKFRISIPREKNDWGLGTCVVLGSSGSGKGYFIVDLIERHWKEASAKNRRRVRRACRMN